MRNKAIILTFLILIAAGCKKEEEILSGNIEGTVTVSSQFGVPVKDYAGIEIDLMQNGVLLQSTTANESGAYYFNNILYGKYYINLVKERFVQPWINEPVYHVGGYSPTFVNSGLYEVPDFTVDIDSIQLFTQDYYTLILYVRVSSDTALNIPYAFRVFAGSSPDVSSEQYLSAGRGFFTNYDPVTYTYVPVYGSIALPYFMDPAFEQLKAGTIYLRIYPLAMGQGTYIGEYRAGALGKPSNIIAVRWEDLKQFTGF